jgi:hypothetical protein
MAELADEAPLRPVTDLGGRGGDLEEALGTAIAARVREFRLQLGWTVGQLAAKRDQGMLSRSERPGLAEPWPPVGRSSPVTAFFPRAKNRTSCSSRRARARREQGSGTGSLRVSKIVRTSTATWAGAGT